jgi:outer membrane immunogenic protein
MLASLRGRLGVGFDKILLYGTGGVAFTDARIGNWDYEHGEIIPATSYSLNRVGWVAGIGAEYRLRSNWSALLQFSHYDFGVNRNSQQIFSDDRGPGGKNGLKVDVVQLGVNYRFQ